jgi:gliding motility-associated-like protein
MHLFKNSFHFSQEFSRKIVLLFVLLFTFSTAYFACDKTSTTVNSVVNNGNGTYTVTLTACMEPADATGCSASLMIQFNAGTKILSVNKPTLTYLNGTVHTAAAITGNSNTLTWSGSSVCTTTNASKNECFTISVVVNSNPTTLYTENGHSGCSHTATFPTVTNLTCTTSGGTFTDGAGNYGNDLNQTTIICPDNPGEKVQVAFTGLIDSKGAFGSCVVSQDNMYIYQGNVPGTNLVGMYCQNSAAPGTITSTDPSGCLTFQFISNSSGVATGWTSTVTCSCTTPVLSIHNPAAVCSPATVDLTDPAVTAGSSGGGTLTYWTNIGCTNPLANPSAVTSSGTYYIKAANGSCTDIKPVTVTVNGPAKPTVTVTQPTCTTPTGTIMINTPIGTYTYSKDGITYQAGTTFSGLTPANYTITVKDAGGCTSSDAFTINAAPTPPSTPTTTPTQPTCSVSTGTIVVNSPTGVGYTYSIDGNTFQAGTTFSGLAANTYTITVKNATGCTATSTSTLNNPPGAPAQATEVITQPTCSTPTGSVSITAPLGAFTYSIDGTTFQGTTTFSGLTPANYTITVKDAGGCTSTKAITINAVPAPPSTPVASLTQPTCLVNTGTITVTAPLGAYTYSIDGTTFQAGTTFSNLPANNYTITVKDVGGCTATDNETLSNPPGAPVQASTTVTQPTCLVNTGTITITAPLGAFTYSIDGTTFQAGTVFSGLAPNTYVVSVKDGVGCTSTINAIVSPAAGAPSNPSLNITQPSCLVATGTITITAPLGSYTYSIDGTTYQAGTTFSGLTPGNYTITVKDGTGCTSSKNDVINNPPATPISETSTLTQPTCLTPTGTISITSPLGAYTYSIDGATFQASTQFTNLAPGNYTISVKNAAGCLSTNNETINAVPAGPPNPIAIPTQPSCQINTGTIPITTPIGAYTYSKDGITFQAGTTFNGLTPGNYTITVKDGIGCTSSSNFTIDPKPANPPTPITNVTQPTCQIVTGTIFVTSPLGAYTYSVDGVNFVPTTVFNALAANTTYTVTVKDAGGCTSSTQASISASLAIPTTPTANLVHASCSSPTGSITVTSPLGNNTYSLDGGNYQAGTQFGALNPGVHTISVKNNVGCTSTGNFTINVAPNPPAAPFVLPKQPDCNSATGDISVISPLGAGLQYSMDNLNFQATTTFSNLLPGVYTVYVKDANNCFSQSNTKINPQPIIPKASFSYNPTEVTMFNTEVFFTNSSQNATSYRWNFDDGTKFNTTVNPTHEFPGTANVYFVKLTAFNNACWDDTTIAITVIEKPIIYVPNTFTPNGDEINNTFIPVIAGGISSENYTLYIYNRWGELLFESHNKDYGWDGTYGNKLCMPDTYIWKIEYKESVGAKQRKYSVGHVNLLY